MVLFKNIYFKIKSSEFVLHFKILATGTLLSQILLLTSSPFVTRLYSPEAFGILAIFLAIISFITPVIDAGYERAIISVKEDRDSNDLFILSILITFFASIILLIFLFLFEEPLKQFLNAKKLHLWWYVIPFIIFLNNLNKIIKTYANRFKNYKLIANVSIVKSIFYIIIVLGCGYLGFSSDGLFFAEISVSLIIIIFIITVYKKFLKKINFSSRQRLKKTAKKFIKFPVFVIGPVLLNNLNTLIPIIFLIKFYPASVVGYYFLALKAIHFPISFISSSISSLHLKKTSELINQKKTVKTYFIKIMLILISVILIPLTLIILTGPELFEFVFGNEWKIAGEFAQIVMPAVAITFVVSSLCSVMIPANKLNHYAIWSIISFVSIFIFFYFFSNQLEIKQLLKYFTMLKIGIYVFYFVLILNSVVQIDKKLLNK